MNKKKLLPLLLAAVLLLSFLPVSARADGSSTLTYRGREQGFDVNPGSAWTAADLFDGLKDVMPGDVRACDIAFVNAATDCDFAVLTLTAEPHGAENPLSESVAAAGETVKSAKDFLNQMTLTVTSGGQTLYDGPAGSDAMFGAGVALGTVRTGEQIGLHVVLSVPKEMDNDYASRAGEIDWVFHVETYNESQITVRKVWSEGNGWHKNDSVKVNLLRDGETVRTEELSAANQWTYTFERLVEGHEWSVEEAEVPAGYTVSYRTEGNLVTILNTARGAYPDYDGDRELTVVKKWEGKRGASSVTMALYNGAERVKTVELSDENGWAYTFADLDPQGNWQVIEQSVPKGYTPVYEKNGSTVTVTNTDRLIQTGVNNALVWVLAAAGALLVIAGAVLLKKRKKA